MKPQKIAQFLTLNLVISFSFLSPVLAQTSISNPGKTFNSQSEILPYLLENPQTGGSLIRVRCISTERQETRETHRRIIRDTLLQRNSQNTVIVEIEGDCDAYGGRSHRSIRGRYNQRERFDDFAPDDYWLNRPGSGWDWQLRH
jgi:hypothetical protein